GDGQREDLHLTALLPRRLAERGRQHLRGEHAHRAEQRDDDSAHRNVQLHYRRLAVGSTAERETLRVESRTERIEEPDALTAPSVLRVLSQHVRDLPELRRR